MLTVLLFLLCGIARSDLNSEQCETPRIRKEWRSLSNNDKLEYIQAVKCLWDTPAKGTAFWPVKSRFDDFVALHINATTAPKFDANGDFTGLVGPGVHFNGVFLPFHRYLLWTYEDALRDECNYTGAQPFWDWTLDSASNNGAQLMDSPLFDPVYGFGGNGVGGSVPLPPITSTSIVAAPLGNCVIDGPFANVSLTLGFGYNFTAGSRCMKRNFQPNATDSFLGSMNVNAQMARIGFANFSSYIDKNIVDPTQATGLHGGGHVSVGGDMLDLWSSPNDPLFFLHHCNLDRLWALWQRKESQNLYDMGGPIYTNMLNSSQDSGTTTLDYIIDMGQYMAPPRPINQVMDTLNGNGEGILCYDYDRTFSP